MPSIIGSSRAFSAASAKQLAKEKRKKKRIGFTKVEYSAIYLKSGHWQGQRKQALRRAKHRCQHCESTRRLEVHHLSYERLGREKKKDLIVLCAICHEKEHVLLDAAKAIYESSNAINEAIFGE